MPNFDIVLRLDEDEKEQLSGACDAKTFTAAVKAHEARMKEHSKTMSLLLRDKLTADDLKKSQTTLPALRELVEQLSESEAKANALEQIVQAEETLAAISEAQESLLKMQQAADSHA